MKAICPQDATHDRFTTTAHVMQEWVVEADGTFVETFTDCLEVTHGPNDGNLWSCLICGAEAIVERD